jgi:DNA replication protein DnaC
LLVGVNGTGKTHVACALYRHAIAKRRKVVYVPVREMLEEYRKWEFPKMSDDGQAEYFKPRVTPDDLRILNGPKWTLVLEEFDKARASEYAAEQLFNLIDVAVSFEHQLIVTSNYDVERLQAHWSKMNETYGPSIVRRLTACTLVKMF